NDQGRHAESFEHQRRVSAQLRRISEKDDAHFPCCLAQFARHDESVSSVVPFTADDGELGSRWILFENELGDGGTGIRHERVRRDTKTFTGDAIDFAHLGRADDFHTRAPAICSSSRSWEGSPIAIRKSPGSMRSSGAGLKRMPFSRLI